MRTLVLWDVDHTLVDISGISGRLYAAAFAEVFGRPLEAMADMAGRTDRAIMSDTLGLHGITPSETILRAFAEVLAKEFEDHAGEIGEVGKVLPGALDALTALAANPRVRQSVLTGNMRPIAECKLDALGLRRFVDLDIGAFGFDSAERPPLVDIARKRAAGKYGESFDAATTVLIGDTPHDVAAGRLGGARVVAVATGLSDEQVLRAAGADVVMPDLRDTAAVTNVVIPE